MVRYGYSEEEREIGYLRERDLAEKPLIEQLTKHGWMHIPSHQLDRESTEEVLLTPRLREALKRINAVEFKGLIEKDVEKVLDEVLLELKTKSVDREGHREIMELLKYGLPVNLGRKGPATIHLFDYAHIENNEFIVSNQVTFTSIGGKARADVVLFINGIPIVIIECKDPTNPSLSWEDGYRQIKEYEKIVPELFKYIQINAVFEGWEGKVRYFASEPWYDHTQVHVWKKDSGIHEFLTPEGLLDIVKFFAFFREERGSERKVLARYMQYRAVNKIVDRVRKYVKEEENTSSALIWHWQGSGKTLTMIFTANKLMRDPLLENPTIFFVLDRRELEDQMFEEINALKINLQPTRITSTSELKETLLWDEGKGKRGMFVVLVHKFRPGEFEEVKAILEEATANARANVLTRRNIIVLVDEADRTQYGVFASNMRNLLRGAFFVGFTGTPLNLRERNTFAAFCPDGKTYLDKYFIDNSIEDGFTLPIALEPHVGEEIKVEKEKLEKIVEEFLEQQEYEEIPEESIKIAENTVAKRLNELNVVLENPERIEEIAKHIAGHFRANVDGRFKAMVACATRKACVLYKRALDKHLPANYSEIVMTFTPGDPEIIKDYEKTLRKNYGTNDLEEILQNIRDGFKKKEYPKILIVTDMLLRGFDAPVLQTLYLDKLLKGHRLLQAIARVNRPFKEREKAYGLIVDYVGILKRLEKAFEMYQREDYVNVVVPVAQYVEELKNEIEKMKALLGNGKLNFEPEHLTALVSMLLKEKKEKEFAERFRKIRNLFELIGPHRVKSELYEYYRWLVALYSCYKRLNLDPAERIAEKLYKHTLNVIGNTTEFTKLDTHLENIIVDPKFLHDVRDYNVGVFNAYARIRNIPRERIPAPVYQRIVEKVEKIMQAWKEKKERTEDVYNELKEVVEEAETIPEEMKKTGLSFRAYAIADILKNTYKITVNEDKLKELDQKLSQQMIYNWSNKPSAVKNVGKEIRLFLIEQKVEKEKRNEVYEKVLEMLKENF